jgi:hypothetical protein
VNDEYTVLVIACPCVEDITHFVHNLLKQLEQSKVNATCLLLLNMVGTMRNENPMDIHWQSIHGDE